MSYQYELLTILPPPTSTLCATLFLLLERRSVCAFGQKQALLSFVKQSLVRGHRVLLQETEADSKNNGSRTSKQNLSVQACALGRERSRKVLACAPFCAWSVL